MEPSETELSALLNDGIVSPPELPEEPSGLLQPEWQPTTVQIEVARKQALRTAAILAFLVLAFLLILSQTSGSIP